MNDPDTFIYLYFEDNQAYISVKGKDEDIIQLIASGMIADKRFDDAIEVANEYFFKYGKARN